MIFQTYFNPVMIFLELIFLTTVLFLSFYLIYRYIGRTSKTDKKVFNRSAGISCLIIFLIIFGVKFLFQILENLSIFTYFNKPHFILAIMFTLFIPIYNLLRKKFTPDKKIGEEYKKWANNFLVLYWILSLLFLLTDIFFHPLYNSEILHLEFIWGVGTLAFLFILTDLINTLKNIESRYPKHILNKTKITGAFLSFFIWFYQFFIFGVFLREILNSGSIEEDIRIQILSMIIIYAVSFRYFLNKKYLPAESKRVEQEILASKMRLEEKSKEGVKIQGEEIVIKVEGLRTYFYTEEGVVRALEDVSFEVIKGEVLGLVGETGCGKSVTALSLQKLVPPPGKIETGKVMYKGENLLEKTDKEILDYRGRDIAMIFQDPLNSLNPVFKVGDQISEVYLLHMQDEMLQVVDEYALKIKEKNSQIQELRENIKLIDEKDTAFSPDTTGKVARKKDGFSEQLAELMYELAELNKYSSIYSVAKQWGINLLDDLNIPNADIIYDQYPHALSGGMRQRIQIAMALACSPKLLIADEPTTALDVTIQNQILKLMQNLLKDYDTSILFITHDLGIISRMCDRVAVMYSGYIVEYGARNVLFKKPYHPYTAALLDSIPKDGEEKKDLAVIHGSVPNLIYPPSGCRFHPRCLYCFEPCDSKVPLRIEVEPKYYVACHLYDPQYKDLVGDSIHKIKQN